jgi:hypothetical protein
MATSRSPQSSGPVHPTRQQLDELDALLQRMLDLPVNQLEDVPPPPETEPEPAAPGPTPGSREGEEPKTVAASAPSLPAPSMPSAPNRTPPVSYTVVETPKEPSAPAGQGPAPPAPPAAPKQEDAGEWVPLKSSWRPSAQTWGPLAEKWQQTYSAGEPSPAPPAAPAEEAKTPEPLSPPTAENPPIADAPGSPSPVADAPGSPSPVADAPGSAARRSASRRVAAKDRLKAELQPPAAPHSPLGENWPAAASPRSSRPSWTLRPLVSFNRGFYACLSPLGPPGHWLSGPAGRTLLGVVGLLCLGVAGALVLVGRIAWTR